MLEIIEDLLVLFAEYPNLLSPPPFSDIHDLKVNSSALITDA